MEAYVPALVVRRDGGDLRLLQHDLADPDLVRALCFLLRGHGCELGVRQVSPPRKSLARAVPGEEGRVDVGEGVDCRYAAYQSAGQCPLSSGQDTRARWFRRIR